METQPGVVEAIGQGVAMVTCGDSFTTAVTKSMLAKIVPCTPDGI